MHVRIPIFKAAEINEQCDKIIEEAKEVHAAHHEGESKERFLEESWDTIQATLNGMSMKATPQEIFKSGMDHEIKMRKRGYEGTSTVYVMFRGE